MGSEAKLQRWPPGSHASQNPEDPKLSSRFCKVTLCNEVELTPEIHIYGDMDLVVVNIERKLVL